MSNVNCIHNANINANVGFEAVVVVAGRANAHRALPTKTCDTYPVKKCPYRMYLPSPHLSDSSSESGLRSGDHMHPVVLCQPQDSWRQKRRFKRGSIMGQSMRGVRSTISG